MIESMWFYSLYKFIFYNVNVLSLSKPHETDESHEMAYSRLSISFASIPK